MGYNLLFLGLVISLLAVGAAPPPELSAYISEPALMGMNCNPSGGPAVYTARVYVENNRSMAMFVNYSYFDFPSGVMVAGGRACTVAPKSGEYCTVTIPVRLGGEGAGVSETPLILFGSWDGEALSKRLNLTLNHSPTSTEANVLGIIDSAQERLTAQTILLDSVCDAGICCGMVEAKGALGTASDQLAAGRSHVRACAFSDAAQSGYSAASMIQESSAAYRSALPACNSALASYSNAKGNLTAANNTIYRRAACGMAVNGSRAELARASSFLSQASSLIESDAYQDVPSILASASESTGKALSLSDDCPPANLAPPEIAPTAAPTPAPQQSDTLSKFMGALGYIIIAAIIVVIGAAVYITLGKKKLEGEGDYYPRPPPPSAPGPEIGTDHSKIDREFQDWLKQAEHEEKKGKKKGAS